MTFLFPQKQELKDGSKELFSWIRHSGDFVFCRYGLQPEYRLGPVPRWNSPPLHAGSTVLFNGNDDRKIVAITGENSAIARSHQSGSTYSVKLSSVVGSVRAFGNFRIGDHVNYVGGRYKYIDAQIIQIYKNGIAMISSQGTITRITLVSNPNSSAAVIPD